MQRRVIPENIRINEPVHRDWSDLMANKKTDVFDYLDWRGDITFQQVELNEIDSLILSIFA